jgi:hypothetical protein
MLRYQIADVLLTKINVKLGATLSGFLLIGGGMYMCFTRLSANGSIDLKAVFVEGKIQTGSLGLFTIFLGTVVILAVALSSAKPFEGQEVKLVINGNEITGKCLSYGKLRELLEVALPNISSPETNIAVRAEKNEADSKQVTVAPDPNLPKKS